MTLLEAEKLLDLAMRELNLSAPTARILKVGRTIADLAGENAILPEHISEAVQYRALDAPGVVEGSTKNTHMLN